MGLFTKISRAWLTIDNLIFIWNLTTYEKDYKLRGHTGCVNVLNIYQKKYLLRGLNDGTVRVWDTCSEFSLFKILDQSSQPILSIDSMQPFIAVDSKDNTIYV